ncbi:MAG: DUF2851 family protein [Chloroflexi bacterium]|nr:DUF2851 family protein [Chloroflexota bacterium]
MATDKKEDAILPERLAARLWRNRQGGGILRTLGGKSLRVVYPGRPNGGPGPDFRDALVQGEDGHLIRGDVEVHREAADWRRHGHQRDPRYNGVVLHLVFGEGDGQKGDGGLAGQERGRDEGQRTYREDGQPVPLARVELLGPSQGEQGDGLPPALWDYSRLATLRGMPGPEMERALEAAGDQRFLARSASYALALGREDADEVLYRGILEGLGYSRNRAPFLALGLRLPWRGLRRAALDAPPAARAGVLYRRLMDVSGLAERGDTGAATLRSQRGTAPPSGAWRGEGEETPLPGRGVAHLSNWLPRFSAPGASQSSSTATPLPRSLWCLAGLRPQNHPARRLAGAAELFARCVEPGLVLSLKAPVLQGSAAALLGALTVARGGGSLIGRDRALDIAVNAVLPTLHALGTLGGDTALAEGSLALYRRAPRLGDNEVLREMARLLGLSQGGLGRTARQQQGALHLYKALLEEGNARIYGPTSQDGESLHEGAPAHYLAASAA